MGQPLPARTLRVRLPPLLGLFVLLKVASALHACLEGGNNITVSLEASDVAAAPAASGYVVRITGESKNYFLEFEEFNSSLPRPIAFQANYHGLGYVFTLLVVTRDSAVKPSRSVTVLTKPLPVSSVSIYDYKPSPETGVLFEIHYPEKYNVFTRVNISYWEGTEFQSMLYKDFFKGKTVFNHWLSGICYSNITFQLVSKAVFNKSTLVEISGVGHEPKQHRTAPYPPRNISIRFVNINKNTWEEESGNFPEESFTQPQDSPGGSQLLRVTEEPPETPSGNSSWGWLDSNSSDDKTTPQPSWWGSAMAPENEDEFVGVLPVDYGNLSSTPKSAADSLPSFPVQMILSWLPPKPTTAFDSFHILIEREGNLAENFTVGEETHELVAELKEPGHYKVSVTTLSSSGSCPPRKSQAAPGLNFYLSPEGEWMESLREKPAQVQVQVLSPTTAMVSWTSSEETDNRTLISVVSLTCQKQKPSQRLERKYCTQVNTSKPVLEDLVPGAQYQVVLFLRKGPLTGPPSDPVTFAIAPTGIRDLALLPLGPTAVVLSWSRPHIGVFRKYVVEMFHFNPATLTSEWTTHYEIAASVSVASSVLISNLLPAWYYNFRVTMATWGEPELRCCDSATISIVTAPVAPEITSVDYINGLVYVSWTYGDTSTDLVHSRLLHWAVVAEGRKKIRKSVSRSVTTAILSLPPGDAYNLSVTACTERRSNTSELHLIRLEPAPVKSLFAVNKTQTSVTLLWVAEGLADFFQVLCRQAGSETKLQEPLVVSSHVTTIPNLLPATAYNCGVSSVSGDSASPPAFIEVSTSAVEMNGSVVAISVLALLSTLLIALLLLTLLILRKKHLQMARECGARTFVNFASLEQDRKLPYNWSKNGLKKRKLTNPVQLDDFDSYIKDMAKDSDYKFSLQFEELKLVGLNIPHYAADLPLNRCKNRYTNILPYDFSRVKLVSVNGEEGADYINANYIPGYSSPQEYIATQGPLPETRSDFWKMILQQKSQIIVMLTQCNEKRRVKCDHYWPFTRGEPTAYGDVTVEMLSEEDKAHWACRHFRIHCADETQDVTHFNYTAWPDHGVPSANAAESILQFVYLVRRHAGKSKGPVVIHCSAGVGRTGTFIALDRLLQHVRDHEFVDILGLVSEMRAHRMCMVQTEEQYIFIHQCVRLLWRRKRQRLRLSDVVYENVGGS